MFEGQGYRSKFAVTGGGKQMLSSCLDGNCEIEKQTRIGNCNGRPKSKSEALPRSAKMLISGWCDSEWRLSSWDSVNGNFVSCLLVYSLALTNAGVSVSLLSTLHCVSRLWSCLCLEKSWCNINSQKSPTVSCKTTSLVVLQQILSTTGSPRTTFTD